MNSRYRVVLKVERIGPDTDGQLINVTVGELEWVDEETTPNAYDVARNLFNEVYKQFHKRRGEKASSNSTKG